MHNLLNPHFINALFMLRFHETGLSHSQSLPHCCRCLCESVCRTQTLILFPGYHFIVKKMLNLIMLIMSIWVLSFLNGQTVFVWSFGGLSMSSEWHSYSYQWTTTLVKSGDSGSKSTFGSSQLKMSARIFPPQMSTPPLEWSPFRRGKTLHQGAMVQLKSMWP